MTARSAVAVLLWPVLAGLSTPPLEAQSSEGDSQARLARELAPRIVAPGADGASPGISGSCPLFLWTGVEGADAYELWIGRDDLRGSLPLWAEVPGGATGWSPPGTQCLEPGSYSWTVRSRFEGVTSEWSEAGRFEISASPTAEEVEWATGVLERFLRGSEGKPDTVAGAPDQGAGSDSESTSTDPTAASGVDLLLSADTLSVESIRVINQIQGEFTATGAFEFLHNSTQMTRMEADSVTTSLLDFPRLVLNGSVHYTGSDLVKSGGGAGFFQIPSLFNIDVDDNAHVCDNGGILRGLRLTEHPADQLSFDLYCTE